MHRSAFVLLLNGEAAAETPRNSASVALTSTASVVIARVACYKDVRLSNSDDTMIIP